MTESTHIHDQAEGLEPSDVAAKASETSETAADAASGTPCR